MAERRIPCLFLGAMIFFGVSSSALAQGDPTLSPTPLGPPEAQAPAPTPDPDDPDLPPPLPPNPVAQPLPEQPLPEPAAMPPAPEPPMPEPAAAETYPPPAGGITRSPSLIAECLCSERRTASLHEQAARTQREYSDAKNGLASMNEQLERSKTTVNSDDPDQVDAYRRLLLSSEQANARLFNDILPRSQTVIGRYNEEVQRYNRRCTGRRFDREILAQVTATLTCP